MRRDLSPPIPTKYTIISCLDVLPRSLSPLLSLSTFAPLPYHMLLPLLQPSSSLQRTDEAHPPKHHKIVLVD
uniref:Uncharacterized protein n=1 Tax=Triticum urartu TaxID=4572 RepID=A0A8R7R2R6_TRIUA